MLKITWSLNPDSNGGFELGELSITHDQTMFSTKNYQGGSMMLLISATILLDQISMREARGTKKDGFSFRGIESSCELEFRFDHSIVECWHGGEMIFREPTTEFYPQLYAATEVLYQDALHSNATDEAEANDLREALNEFRKLREIVL